MCGKLRFPKTLNRVPFTGYSDGLTSSIMTGPLLRSHGSCNCGIFGSWSNLSPHGYFGEWHYRKLQRYHRARLPRLIPFTVLAIFRLAPARVLRYGPPFLLYRGTDESQSSACLNMIKRKPNLRTSQNRYTGCYFTIHSTIQVHAVSIQDDQKSQEAEHEGDETI